MVGLNFIDMSISFASGVVANLLIALIGAIISLSIESKWGILHRLNKVICEMMKKSASILLLITYKSEIPFDQLKKISLDVLKEHYHIKIYNNTNHQLDVLVNNSFHIIVDEITDSDVIFKTTEINSTVNSVIETTRKTLDMFSNIKNQIKKNNYEHDEKSFTIILDLPFKSTYTKIYPPKDIITKKYKVEMSHPNANEICLKENYLHISSTQEDDLIKVIKYFV